MPFCASRENEGIANELKQFARTWSKSGVTKSPTNGSWDDGAFFMGKPVGARKPRNTEELTS
jgi:hypothetical protein